MCDAFVNAFDINGVELLLDQNGVFSYDELTPGIYMILQITEPQQGKSGNVLTFKPHIFNNLKYDENGNVVGEY